LSVVNMLYLPISRYSTSVFQCVTLPDGSSVLKAFPDMLCYSKEHTVFMCLGCVGISLCTHAVGAHLARCVHQGVANRCA
jgi:hypothetical protein